MKAGSTFTISEDNDDINPWGTHNGCKKSKIALKKPAEIVEGRKEWTYEISADAQDGATCTIFYSKYADTLETEKWWRSTDEAITDTFTKLNIKIVSSKKEKDEETKPVDDKKKKDDDKKEEDKKKNDKEDGGDEEEEGGDEAEEKKKKEKDEKTEEGEED